MKKLVTLVLAVIVTLTLSACTGGTSVAASTIAIDVNPSIVLELDENDTVINVILNNEDAEVIIGDMDLVGVDYNVAINALIGSMVANGYINELANSILLSVQSNDETHESDLMVQLAQAINEYLQGSSIEGSVITQRLDLDQDAEDLAELFDISEAKAELILDIIELDPRMTVEDLAVLSINDLNLLLETKNYSLDNVNKTGSASALGLITIDEAYQAALLALGVDELAVLKLEIDLEQEDGIMVYEIEIETDTDKYEIYIDAKEGTVYVEIDDDDDDDDDEVFPVDALSEVEVLEILATSLELNPTLITEIEFDQEMENGVAFYEVEFVHNGTTEYELEVDALTGEIYSYSIDEDDDYEDEEDIEDEIDNEDESDDEMDNEDESDDEIDNEDESDDEMDNEDGSDDTDTTTDTTTELPVFTLDELANYTGANGSLAYIAVDGIIYDATSIFNNGQHQGLQIGGTDATDIFESSPHSASLLETLEIVGTLE
jgi:predicted heme/steroid binding protein/uncharacterized membrane protein YkoI